MRKVERPEAVRLPMMMKLIKRKKAMKCTTVNAGYIEIEGDRERVRYIDNSKYKICLSEAYVRPLHVLDSFSRS